MNKKLLELISEIGKKIQKDYLPAFSAQAAFFLLLSFFPFVLFLLNLAKYLPFSQIDVENLIRSVAPYDVSLYMVNLIDELYNKVTGTLVSLSIITLIWSASKGMLAIMNGLNAVYQTLETRRYLPIRVIATLYTFVVAVMVVVMLSVFVFGNTIVDGLIKEYSTIEDLMKILVNIRPIVGIIIILGFFMLIYKVLPNHKEKKKVVFPGAIFSTISWMIFSYMFSMIVDNVANLSRLYGSLTKIIVVLLWLYVSMFILFLGAELNYFLREGYLTRFKNVIK